MKRKNIAWLVVTCLMVAALLLASCAPAVVEEKKVTPPVAKEVAPPVKEKEVVVPGKEVVPSGPEMVKVTLTKLDGTVVEKMMEKPRYGGVYTTIMSSAPDKFDGAFGSPSPAGKIYNEFLTQVDWTRGPTGTGELELGEYEQPFPEIIGNSLTESIEMPDPDTLVIHLRKGVHWHNKPPTSGREFVAADVVFTFNRVLQSPRSWQYTNVPYGTHTESITAPDKYTVVIKAKPGKLAEIYEGMTGYVEMASREAVEKYGNLTDWKNAVGVGPFMLVDYVTASSLTYVRNPDFWDVDPFFPENQLPYLDGVKQLIIGDISTIETALRTGKIDALVGVGPPTGLSWESFEMFRKAYPELKYKKRLGRGHSVRMRVDQKPFDDIRVRRALFMAIDYQSLKDQFYGGHAELLSFPLAPIADQMDMFIPLEEFPASVRELYTYNPDKARRLLAEAGYPDGFKTQVLCNSTYLDMNTILKEYWAKIGVDLTLNVKEPAVAASIADKRAFEGMYSYGVGFNRLYSFQFLGKGLFRNYGNVDDPVINEAWAKVSAAYFNDPLRRRLMKEITPYILEQAYIILPPAPYGYTMWWPWVKGYSGEDAIGFTGGTKYVKWIWLDQALKKAMGR